MSEIVDDPKARNYDWSSSCRLAGRGFEIITHGRGNELAGEKGVLVANEAALDYIQVDDRFSPLGHTGGDCDALDRRYETTPDATVTVSFNYSTSPTLIDEHGEEIANPIDEDAARDVFQAVDDALTDREGDSIELKKVTVDMPHDWKQVEA